VEQAWHNMEQAFKRKKMITRQIAFRYLPFYVLIKKWGFNIPITSEFINNMILVKIKMMVLLYSWVL